jgi:hypothetical protein
LFSHLNLSVLNHSYRQWFLNARWAFKPTTYGYEPPVTDASKANKQHTKKVRLQLFMLCLPKFGPCDA